MVVFSHEVRLIATIMCVFVEDGYKWLNCNTIDIYGNTNFFLD
jgi:hypothetical protein